MPEIGLQEVGLQEIGLKEAAQRLGVHYMTAYRYVRTGRLLATRRDGRWWVGTTDLEQFGSPVSARPGRRQVDPAVSAARLSRRLVAGDEHGAWHIVDSAIGAGRAPTSVLLDVLAPALRLIGDGWERGELTVGDEHRATTVATRLIGRLGPHFARRGRTKGSVLLTCVPNERHALPASMLARVLQGNGYDVIELGADTPSEEIARAVSAAGAGLIAVCLSTNTPARRDDVREAVAAVRATAEDILVLVGGAGVRSLRRALALGADDWAPDATGVVAVLDRQRTARPPPLPEPRGRSLRDDESRPEAGRDHRAGAGWRCATG